MIHSVVNSIQNKRILLSPLNWGLGHVSRTIPIITTLLENNNEVFICCDNEQELFYRNYFPELWYIPFQGYPFHFRGNGTWIIDILKRFKPLYNRFLKEKNEVEQLIDKFHPDLIISDQRFGFRHTQVRSIIISHQLNLPVPSWNWIAKCWNRRLLKAFDEIWVPDTPDRRLSGNLSKGLTKNVSFIGNCSRFKEIIPSSTKKYKYLIIVSGPIPYSKQFIELILAKFNDVAHLSALIASQELLAELEYPAQITYFSNPTSSEFEQLLHDSEIIISRCGYSTLMDLENTKHSAILIPTPGQKEQLYLAKNNASHANWEMLTEKEFLKKVF
ncbi:MAG: hypothetical protein H3C31_10570 [Brumimicrobium sp.]|nr:hypothetical protein [Brumimicrobium sp.]